MIRVMLADDHQVVRQGLRALIQREADLDVVGEAPDGLEAVRLAESTHPDVVVIDLMMPGLQGSEAVRRIASRTNAPQVIVLSMHADESYVSEALDAGATGYVLKDAGAAELIEAIRSVVDGRSYLSPPLSKERVSGYRNRLSTGELDAYRLLTRREREVLQLVAEGNTNVRIGEILSISPRTVESHRSNVMHKLGLETTSDLVRYAARRGLISLG